MRLRGRAKAARSNPLHAAGHTFADMPDDGFALLRAHTVALELFIVLLSIKAAGDVSLAEITAAMGRAPSTVRRARRILESLNMLPVGELQLRPHWLTLREGVRIVRLDTRLVGTKGWTGSQWRAVIACQFGNRSDRPQRRLPMRLIAVIAGTTGRGLRKALARAREVGYIVADMVTTAAERRTIAEATAQWKREQEARAAARAQRSSGSPRDPPFQPVGSILEMLDPLKYRARKA
ncbi:MAG: hypothetical protein F4107_02555 [Gemmatimonadetes bacterium]|nr:hypothetical protein [Gemmatimonadota bacterium]MYD13952.1 hypothetical protein [Gemmatimonadota bacterium]MYI64806.1 hypothetical protein [Gemmatimonadota bacterium]